MISISNKLILVIIKYIIINQLDIDYFKKNIL